MARLIELCKGVRSKNAGPFMITIDIFCDTAAQFRRLRDLVSTDEVARLYRLDRTDILRFDLKEVSAIKFSFPRPSIQGSLRDRDMHGAGWAALLAELDLGEAQLESEAGAGEPN